ncbi:MAG: tRNA lysidine(34) synthetase TilS [Geobacter sp.]|nr:tRNA lysidine(34) synthetase TilS [Geobacter sp.]
MLKAVLAFIREHDLFRKGERVVVAVSGGADSVALLDILASLEEYRLQLVVAHLNHRLRGTESDGDEAFVRDLAARYGIPCEVATEDVLALSRARKLSLEEAGRLARYRFFDSLAEKHDASAIALAHHADDQAETVLMRLLRGAGTGGLAGMAPKSGLYIRPLLHVRRADIERYLFSRGLSFRTDSSNRDAAFLRNRVRLDLLPLLSSYNPSIAERLADTGEILAADEAYLAEISNERFSRLARFEGGALALSLEELAHEPRSLVLRLIRRAILDVKGDLRALSYRHIAAIERLLSSPRAHATLMLPGGVVVKKSYGTIRFSTFVGEAFVPYEMMIAGSGTYRLPGGFELAIEPASPPSDWQGIGSRTAFIDPSAAPFPWTVRTFRTGDRIRPMGVGGSKKVKDLFIDRKIPLDVRRRLPLLFAGEALLWVAGVVRGDAALVTKSSGEVLKVELRVVDTV